MTQLRIPSALHREIHTDLVRPHEFAGERVGFILAGYSKDSNLLLALDYLQLKDEEYIPAENELACASFGRDAIRRILNLALQRQESIIHVHHHAFGGAAFSRVDLNSLRELLPSFRGVVPDSPHGALIMTDTELNGFILPVSSPNFEPLSKISVVGFPTRWWVSYER